MNILYYSLHQILEDDEVRLFQSLGHDVCCLGSSSPFGSVQHFREAIQFSDKERRLFVKLMETGGEFDFARKICRLTPAFVDQFDLIIVMHDTDFLATNWHLLRHVPTIWRTIGQSVDTLEEKVRPMRAQGLHIVRYSPVETTIPASNGQDAIIRFAKDPRQHWGWTGEIRKILTFSNFYEQRYPEESRAYRQIVNGFPAALGGAGNEAFAESVGAVDARRQQEMYTQCRAYLYASGLDIPYTLNFMEAWMTGIPVIVFAPPARRGHYFEIDRLVTSGRNGFVCDTVASARAVVQKLLEDHDFSKIVGACGREAALSLFSAESVGPQWQRLFEQIAPRPHKDLTLAGWSTYCLESEPPMQTSSSGVFDVLCQLRPYDIDIGKIHIGNERDGGYILADRKLDSEVISFGVGPDVTFEIEMAERGATVYLHDHTVDGLPTEHPRCSFSKKGICGIGQSSADFASLAEHLEVIGTASDGLTLKMDVEGHEWDVFSTIDAATLARFDQIVMEVHSLEHLANAIFRRKAHRALTMINQQFTLHHVHANNCALLHFVDNFAVASVLELSYIRTSLVHRGPSTQVYPSASNKANHPNFPDFPLFFFPFLPTSVENFRFKEVIDRII